MQRRYWFPAKRYGWGWSAPSTWEGWLALAAFVGLVIVTSVLFLPPMAFIPFLGCIAILCIAMLSVCWLKGEPPRWRWGDDEPSSTG